MKVLRCETRLPIIDEDKWIYPWKEYNAVASWKEYSYCFGKHRVPFFLSLHAHLTIEYALEKSWNLLFRQFPFKRLLFVYDVLHGIICSFNMMEIFDWWNARKDDGTMSETFSENRY